MLVSSEEPQPGGAGAATEDVRVKWWFRNRITVGDRKLESQHDQIPLFESDVERVTLLRAHDGTLNVDYLRLDGYEFPSSDDAFHAGRRWRQQLAVALARRGYGADFDPIPLPQRQSGDRPEDPEVPGLLVFPRPSGLSGRVQSWYVFPEPIRLDNFVANDLSTVRAEQPDGVGRRLELAYGLVHLALLNANPEVKFILLVTAVEALIDDNQKKAPEIVEALSLVREFLKRSKAFASDVRDKLVELLQYDEMESINQLGARLARSLTNNYDGRKPDKFFKDCYNGRSRVLHGALTFQDRPTAREIERLNPHLQTFVIDLLASEAATG